MTLVSLAIVIPVALYIVMSSDWAHNKIRSIGESELSALFGVEVNIGSVDFSPFNKLKICDVSVKDDNDSIALKIADIDSRFEIWDLVLRRRIVIDYATVRGLDLKLYRDSIEAPLNISGIIERLKKPETEEKETFFKLRLNDVSLSDCSFSYDVLSEPYTPEKFNPNHISVDSLDLTAFIPILANDRYNVRLRSLSFAESSGFKVDNIKANVDITDTSIVLSGLNIDFPGSELAFGDIVAPIDSLKAISRIADTDMLSISLLEGSHLYLPDFKSFVPILEDFDYTLDVDFDIKGNKDSVYLERFNIRDLNGIIDFNATGGVSGFTHLRDLYFNEVEFALNTDTVAINKVLKNTNVNVSPIIRRLISNLGKTEVTGYADGTLERGLVDMEVRSHIAHATMSGFFSRNASALPYRFTGAITVDSLQLGTLLADNKFNKLSGSIDMEGSFSPKKFDGTFEASIPIFDFKGYTYHDISAKASILTNEIAADININDPNLSTYITGHWEKNVDNIHSIELYAKLNELRLDSLRLNDKYPGYNLKGEIQAEGTGRSIDLCNANILLSDLSFKNNIGNGIKLNSLNVNAVNTEGKGRIAVISDYINGSIDGKYRYSTIVPEVKGIFETLLPALASNRRNTDDGETGIHAISAYNDFDFRFTISNCENICEFFKLPVTLIDKAELFGKVDVKDKLMTLRFDVPWLGQGSNIIESTSLALNLDATDGEGGLYVNTMMPTKKGNMDISANINVENEKIDSKIYWTIRRAIPINGLIDFTTIFNRDRENNLMTQINFNPGKINFGDGIWSIGQSMVTIGNGRALVNNFELSNATQRINVNGVAGPAMADELKIDLNNIQLIDIFETLEIDNVLISGYATGTIDAAAILGEMPIINSKDLKVESIGYNYCTLGDAEVTLTVDDGGKRFNFLADIDQEDGYKSNVEGYIEPGTEKLNLNFDADHIKVGFMKPFMKAFTSDVSGFASGKAHLYGTFKDIDLEGDIYVDDLKIKIDFTNTYYYASDSIHIRPGIIKLQDITIRDEFDHTALLNGWVGHKYFHDATFEFNITQAVNFLSYNVTEKLSPQWYGRIFGNGSATVKGGPGVVDIGVNMSTADNSTFTFVLLDSEEAGEYSFITFRDVTERPENEATKYLNSLPDRVRLAKQRKDNDNQDSPTAYNMDINIDVSPQAQMNIVMDPVGGDRIRAYGAGHLRMTYRSIDNDLRLYGTYTLDRGNYVFTLQDIIIKDFTIKEGSSITFLGDPYNAQLDINAYYQVNANLSDLDKSFLEDKELNRTNVQVRAILMVKGDMLQPDITFDLEFPTLTQDIYRKVRSIVSTEDMMNRQIIYLLALNRFYTPEYMASTTKGNELFSVASSTISSQLSSMLGKLSDNWSIAPNLRSDRGDFSDIEVDLTLSSSLLNNRLLFNGNFGYRDKSLNTNQFVGDFDIEYLLDRSGEWRLKAYNRYNDQNYYLRTAQTTQGVGIVYRKDFDKTFRFLKHLWKPNEESVDTIKIPVDTIIEKTVIEDIVISDSIPQ